MPMTTTDILSLISPMTIFWLVMIVIALIVGLWLGSIGKLNAVYDADSEEIANAIRETKRRKGHRSEPELVKISPRELRLVKTV